MSRCDNHIIELLCRFMFCYETLNLNHEFLCLCNEGNVVADSVILYVFIDVIRGETLDEIITHTVGAGMRA